MKKEIKLNIVKVKYEDVEDCLTQIIEAKEDYHEIVSKNLSEELEEKYASELLDVLGITDFSRQTIHTAVLFDDAIEVFRNKKKKIYRMLFENRQPRITYFMAMQDPFALDASIKANLDVLWLFGGFSSEKFNSLFRQLNVPIDRKELWSVYKQLSMNQALLIDYTSSGTQIKILDKDGETTMF